MRTPTLLIVPSLLAAALAACSPAPVATPAATPGPKAEASIHEIMQSIVAPSADVVWKAVGSVDGKDSQPETDADWLRVRHAALALQEAPTLLVMRGRLVTRPGAAIQDEGLAGNLSAPDIQKRIEANHADFELLALGLQKTATAALAAIDRKDPAAVSEVGGQIDEACEACHLKFWYPAAPAS